MDKPVARLINRKREMNQVNKHTVKKGTITTDITEIKRIIRVVFKKL
jgi:hypothetical protein